MGRAFAEKGLSGWKGEVLIVGREAVAPYERPALSKAFLFGEPPARLPGFHTSVGGGGTRQEPAWYAEHGIQLMMSEEVTAVDTKSKTVTTASGTTLTAEFLILATGAAPVVLSRTPGHDLQGIHYLREVEDGLKLYDDLKAKKGKTCIVIGGGYIGLETAAAATLMGLKVKMIFPEASIMPRLFTPEIADKYETFYAEKGIEIHKDGRLCSEFLGNEDGHVRGVKVKKGEETEEIAGDVVIVGVGARPNTQLF